MFSAAPRVQYHLLQVRGSEWAKVVSYRNGQAGETRLMARINSKDIPKAGCQALHNWYLVALSEGHPTSHISCCAVASQMQFFSYHTHAVGIILTRQYFMFACMCYLKKKSPGGNQNFWLGSIQPEEEIKW